MRTGQERRSKPPRANRSSLRPPPLSQPSLDGDLGTEIEGDARPREHPSGDHVVNEALLELEEHSFRLPLTLPSERHVKSIIPPPPLAPTFDLTPHSGSLEPANVPQDDDEDEEIRESERRRRARQASMQRWALLVTAPLAIIAIAAVVRAAVIWGRAPAAEVNAANVTTATAIATAPPVVASAPPAPAVPRAPEAEPPPPTPKVATPPAAPIIVTAEDQVARDRAAARKDKFEAQAALECGDGRRAQRAAKRATALDPSDAQGWLLLVAAELDCRNPVAANEALKSCLERATRGPRGECIGMVVGRASRARKTMDLKTLSTIEPSDMPPPAP